MAMRPLTKVVLVATGAAPVAWLAVTHMSDARTIGLVAGVALVTWASVRLASRLRPQPQPPPPLTYERITTVRPQRRLDRRPTGRGRRDVRCRAHRTLAQRHPARRPVDR